jgi:hypothetical protein
MPRELIIRLHVYCAHQQYRTNRRIFRRRRQRRSRIHQRRQNNLVLRHRNNWRRRRCIFRRGQSRMCLVRSGQNPQLHIRFWRRLLRCSLDRRRWCRRRRRFRRILLYVQLIPRRNSHHRNLWRRQRLHMHRRALATSRRARYRHQISRRQKEFAALGNDQSRAGELLLQSNRAARRHDAQRIIHIQSGDDVSARPANIQRRRNHRRRENPQWRAGRQLQVNAPEVQRQGDRGPGLQQREFRRPANIHLPSRRQRQPRFSVVHRQHAAVEYETRRTGCRDRRRAVRCRAVVHGNIIPLDAPDRARRCLLPARNLRSCQQRSKRQKQRSHISGSQTKDVIRSELWSGAHRDQREFPSYTIPQWIPTRNQALPQALQPPIRCSIGAARNSRVGDGCKFP